MCRAWVFAALWIAGCTSEEPAGATAQDASDSAVGSGGQVSTGGSGAGGLMPTGGSAGSDGGGTAGSGGTGAAAPIPSIPGGKARFSVVYGNFDTVGTTWARHANYTFGSNGSIAATLWEWDSAQKKGKTAYTQHRCTFEGVTKNCSTYAPTGWVAPAKQYLSASGTFQIQSAGGQVAISWSDGKTETWSIQDTSSSGLKRLGFVSSSYDVTHGVGYGSNASWTTFRTLPEIVTAGGLKKWPGQRVMAGSDGSTTTVSDWSSTLVNLSAFTSASWTSEGYTLHAMLPHSPTVCVGGCTGSHTGKIMYHLASTNTSRQMAYNNWCTCLSIGNEWPCYDRNMHPLALNSIIDDSGTHRGWLFVEQQNQPTYSGYQYQIGYFDDL